MAKLEIEITDELMAKLQKKAYACSITPADMARNILAYSFAEKLSYNWMPILQAIIEGVNKGLANHIIKSRPIQEN